MEEQEKKSISYIFQGECAVIDNSGHETTSGTTRMVLETENLLLSLPGTNARRLALRDILEITEDDYKVGLMLISGETVLLKYLGREYTEFVRLLWRLRSEVIIKDLLMHEPLQMADVTADYSISDLNGLKGSTGSCSLRLYETAIVVIFSKGEPLRIPFSDIRDNKVIDYQLEISTEWGDRYVFRQMGRDLEPFYLMLTELSHALLFKAQALVKGILPEVSPAQVQALANLLKEGRAASRREIEEVGSGAWAKIESYYEALSTNEAFKYLKTLGHADDICIGIKRGLSGEAINDYLWYMVPVYDVKASKPGNSIIMEAISEGEESRATYVFRITSRKEYPYFKDVQSLQVEVTRLLKTVNRALRAINFRREPIYATEVQLNQPRFQSYRYAIARIPELAKLRQLFIARVMHINQEQWQKDIRSILEFNVQTIEDSAVWRKADVTEGT
jgi:hypothetical protein